MAAVRGERVEPGIPFTGMPKVPQVQELRYGPEKGSYVLDLAISKLVHPQGDRSIICVNMRVNARQRGCQTHNINYLLSFVVVLKYYTFKGVSKH